MQVIDFYFICQKIYVLHPQHHHHIALPDSHSFTSVPGICYKYEKVSDDTSSGDRISGNDGQVNSKEMTISLPQKELQSIKQMCQYMYQNPETTDLELTKLLHHLTSTIVTILPAKLQIQALKKNSSHEREVFLNKESQLELFWWGKSIKIYNRRTLIQLPAQALLQIFCLQAGELSGKEWKLEEHGFSKRGCI